MPASITAVSVHLPRRTLANAELAEEFPDWTVEKIAAKTGIESRHVAAADEYSSHLAAGAVRALQAEHDLDPASIDYLIVCTQTPDHLMPAVSSLLHGALGLRADCGAIDLNLGCSGYVYALGIASALLDSGQAGRVVLVTADTYTKLLNPADRGVRTIFGDGATATLLEHVDVGGASAFVYGSDGAAGGALAVPNGGLRPGDHFEGASPETRGLHAQGYDLYMDGPAVFDFAIRIAAPTIETVLDRAVAERGSIDTWVFHQANRFMLGHLRRKLDIPEDRFLVDMSDVGNTVSSTIPIVLARALASGRIVPGSRSLLFGFGVGLSWAGAVVEW